MLRSGRPGEGRQRWERRNVERRVELVEEDDDQFCSEFDVGKFGTSLTTMSGCSVNSDIT